MLRLIFQSIPGGLPGMAVTDGADTVVVIDPATRLQWALDNLSDLTAEVLEKLVNAINEPPNPGLQLVG